MLRRRFMAMIGNFFYWIHGAGKHWVTHITKLFHAPTHDMEHTEIIRGAKETTITSDPPEDLSITTIHQLAKYASMRFRQLYDPVYIKAIAMCRKSRALSALSTICQQIETISIILGVKLISTTAIVIDHVEMIMIRPIIKLLPAPGAIIVIDNRPKFSAITKPIWAVGAICRRVAKTTVSHTAKIITAAAVICQRIAATIFNYTANAIWAPSVRARRRAQTVINHTAKAFSAIRKNTLRRAAMIVVHFGKAVWAATVTVGSIGTFIADHIGKAIWAVTVMVDSVRTFIVEHMVGVDSAPGMDISEINQSFDADGSVDLWPGVCADGLVESAAQTATVSGAIGADGAIFREKSASPIDSRLKIAYWIEPVLEGDVLVIRQVYNATQIGDRVEVE